METVTDEVLEEGAIKAPSTKKLKQQLGSKIVTIKQVEGKFTILPIEGPFRDEVVKKAGCEWKKGTRDVIRGLNNEEEKKYLPDILGISPNHQDWNSTVLEFWNNFNLIVPADKPLEIEVGMKEDVNGNIVPIDVNGYMKYNWARVHSQVAFTEEDLRSKSMFTFYVEDLSAIKDKEIALHNKKKRADAEYVKLVSVNTKDSKIKIDQIVRVISGKKNEFINTHSMQQEEKEIYIDQFKNENPGAFLKIVNDPTINKQALIYMALNVGLMTIEGSSYFMGDQRVGQNMAETIAWFSDKANSEAVSKFVERLKELSK